MSRCVSLGVRVCGAAAFLLSMILSGPASAQTTVVLDNPNGEVVDGFIRAGDYASTVYNNGVLVTKANSSANYVRRALLKFDTQNFVPQNVTVTSATLTLTLKNSESSTRNIAAYRVASSFDEAAATWYRRKSTGSRWTSAGGDLGSKVATASVGTSAGTKVAFNLTSLVQATVKGTYGSRYTRVALVDTGASSSSSLKEFYSSEAADPSVRPKLTVVYGGTTASTTSTQTTTTTTSSSASTLKVLHWNIHYGFGMDGSYGMEKFADWIARINPDLVSLNEVEKNVPGHGNEDQPAILASKLKAKTGRTWYYHHVSRFCGCVSNGGGNLVLSRFPILAKSQLAMSYDRSAALVTLSINGHNVNFVSTHLASESATYRSVQIKQLLPWLRGFSDQLILAGDFNAGLSNIPLVPTEYDDGWNKAIAIGTEQDYAGNWRYGSTFKNGYRIDFVFRAKTASKLVVKSARVYDTRDSRGYMASDHKPVLVTYAVN